MEYKCIICKKDYSSYQSLWIHNKKYHNKMNSQNTQIGHQTPLKNEKMRKINVKTVQKYYLV
jgi:hypothetical protein